MLKWTKDHLSRVADGSVVASKCEDDSETLFLSESHDFLELWYSQVTSEQYCKQEKWQIHCIKNNSEKRILLLPLSKAERMNQFE